MRKSYLSIVPFAACVIAACSSTDLPENDDEIAVGSVSSPIVNGQLDTTHQAVVMLISQQGNMGGQCSGTIIKTDPKTRVGWVLTAAHCTEIPPTVVLQGDDATAPTAKAYGVLDYKADSRYVQGGNPGQPYDIAVVRILGVDENTPTIDIDTASNTVTNGTPFTALGYGRTKGGTGASGDADGKRRRISLVASNVKTTQFSYDARSGGTCQGDSGGPDIVTTGGTKKVIGVHSYVTGDCNYTGTSGRVSGNLTFINEQLNKSVPTLTCDQCRESLFSGDQTCAQGLRKCLADAGCGALYECLGKASSQAAQQACISKYPEAIGKFNAVMSCGCNEGCADVCASAPACKDVPKCGFSIPDNSCESCGESSCCQEMSDCMEDGTCFNCLNTGDAAPACASNAARKKIASCFDKSCSKQCAGYGIGKGTPGDGSGDGSGDGDGDGSGGNDGDGDSPGDATSGTTTTVIKKSGCSASPSGSASGVASTMALSSLALAVMMRRRRRTASR